jgi:predicted MFS family arabinose efflux permease
MRGVGRAVLIVGALSLALVAGLVGLSQLKFTSFLSDSINGRLEVVATSVAQDFGAAIDLGLSLDQVANGSEILTRASRHDPTITAIYIIDVDGTMIHATSDAPTTVDGTTLEAFGHAATGIGTSSWDTESGETIRSGSLIEGSFGQPVGGVVVEYPTDGFHDQARSMLERLTKIGVLVGLALIAVATAVLAVAFRRHVADQVESSRVPRIALAALSGTIAIGVIVFGVLAVPAFNTALAPEIERRAALIGETIGDDTARAIAIGIPIPKLVGMDDYFDEFFKTFPEINHLAVRALDGTVVHASDRVVDSNAGRETDDSDIYQFGIDRGSELEGTVDVGVDSGFVNSRLRDLALDVIVILIVVFVIMLEIFHVAGSRLAPRAGRHGTASLATDPDRSLANIRIVLFLFVVGEELSKSFLPLFVESSDNPIPGLSTSVAISLPIAAYLLAIAVASPFASRLTSAFGQRGLFLIGVVPAALSHLGMVFAENVVQITGLRTITGVGYALATIACLEYVLDRAGSRGRAKGIGAFVAVVIGGTFVGTALGGIIADRLGYSTVFLISFALVVIAGLLAFGLLSGSAAGGGGQSTVVSFSDVRLVLKQPSLLLLMAGVTVPMNVLMAAFLWYLVPLTMASIGSSAAEIARTLMVYYLVILLGSPTAAWIAAKGAKNWALVGFGSVISAVILLLPASSTTVLTMSVAVLVVGIGHAAIRGPQIDLALQIAEAELPGAGREPVLAAMRTLERLGSLVGLLAVAVLVEQFGYNTAIAAVGIVSATAGLVYVALRQVVSGSRIDA